MRTSLRGLSLIIFCATTAHGAFHGDPPDANHPWAVHDANRPQPPRVEPPSVVGNAPSDAVILFNGTEASLENWIHTRPDNKRKRDWIVKDGALQCVPGSGYLASKEPFGDCQLHVEWSAPTPVKGTGQGRGNSGIFLMERIEVQVLDNYENPSYPDGSAGAVYGVMPPAANALRAPGEWQSYDIIFRRPIVRDGVLIDEGSMTVLVNGVVVQDSTPLEGGGGHMKRKALNTVYPEKGRLSLQDHGNPVRYRNIWYRPLRPRAADGGTDGRISEEASLAKRAELAATIRSDAQKLDGMARILRQMESLAYAEDSPTWTEAERGIEAYLKQVNSLSKEEQNNQREPTLQLHQALKYLQKHNRIPKENPSLQNVGALIDAQGWKKK